MGMHSAIEWTDATWNPWQGCTKVSPACAHCYMFRDLRRYGRDPSVVRRSASGTFELPLKQDRYGNWKIPSGSKVFTCSWSDWFHEAADPWRPEAWDIIRQRPDLIFQIVTKRTERIAQCLPGDWGDGWPNVWLLATVENQEWLERRMADFEAVRAVVRGLSIEPLLGRADVSPYLEWLDWVIVGGESGNGARPMHPLWVMSVWFQCMAARVPFFFKQWGDWQNGSETGSGLNAIVFSNGHVIESPTRERCHEYARTLGGDQTWNLLDPSAMARVGKKRAGRLLNGRTWDEFPASFERSPT